MHGTPRSGTQPLHANLYPARRRLQSNNRQNKKLFSDIAIGAFRCDG